MSYAVSDCISKTLKFCIDSETNNVIVGHDSYTPLTKNYTNCNILGNNVHATGNNQVQLGNSQTNVYSVGGIQNTSDLRDKTLIRDTMLGIDFISKLRPVDFKWNFRNDYINTTADYEEVNGIRVPIKVHLENDGSKTRHRYHHGLIAQEVKQAMDDLGIDFGGYQDHTINGGDEQLTISYTEFIAPMIKSIHELKAEGDSLKSEILSLKAEVDSLKVRVDTMKNP